MTKRSQIFQKTITVKMKKRIDCCFSGFFDLFLLLILLVFYRNKQHTLRDKLKISLCTLKIWGIMYL